MQTASKKVVNGWAMYDWANSVYNLVITTTFFPIYFIASTRAANNGSDRVDFLGRNFENSALYDYCIAFAYLVIAALYPILTSIADIKGNKKNFMRFFCYMGALGCSGLYLFRGENLSVGIICFILAAMGYVGSLVFYNAYLPEIAAPEDRDRISARGFSYGYIGSVLMQIVGFALVMTMPDAGLASRITFLLVGIWWFGFAQVTFFRLPAGAPSQHRQGANIFTEGFSEMKKVYRQVTHLPVLKRFLRGFFFYSMGVQTVMLAATIFGSKMLGLEDTKLIITVVIIQLVAILGAWGMARLSAKYGNLRVLMGVVLFWIVVCLAAYRISGQTEPVKPFQDRITALNKLKIPLNKDQEKNAAEIALIEEGIRKIKKEMEPLQRPIEFGFYGLAVAVGLVMGGIQSLSRSTYAKLMPETTDTASFFSYYDFTEKIAIVIGMFSFGIIEEITGSMANSVLALIVFFAIGFAWLISARQKQLAAHG